MRQIGNNAGAISSASASPSSRHIRLTHSDGSACRAERRESEETCGKANKGEPNRPRRHSATSECIRPHAEPAITTICDWRDCTQRFLKEGRITTVTPIGEVLDKGNCNQSTECGKNPNANIAIKAAAEEFWARMRLLFIEHSIARVAFLRGRVPDLMDSSSGVGQTPQSTRRGTARSRCP